MSDYKLTTAPASSIGRAVYTLSKDGIPPMYRPTVTVSITPNRTRTNHAVAIRGRYPLVSNEGNVWKQSDMIKLDLDFTALQNVVVDAQVEELKTFVWSVIDLQWAKIKAGAF